MQPFVIVYMINGKSTLTNNYWQRARKMVRLIFKYLYPALIPLFIYCLWLLYARSKARKNNLESIPKFGDGPFFLMLMATLMMGIGAFLLLALNQEKADGLYIPPHVENGLVVPGKLEK